MPHAAGRRSPRKKSQIDMDNASALSAGTGSKAPSNSSGHLSHDQKTALRKAASASFAGNLIEWFGYAACGFLATNMVTVLFPSEDRSLALLTALFILAVSSLPCAIGPAFWGNRADRHGHLYTFLVPLSTAAGLLTAACSPRPGLPR